MAGTSSLRRARREVLGGLLAVGAMACTPRARPPAFPTAPDGSVPLAAGPSLVELTTGRVTVLDFWATWCEPCRVSIPKVIDFAARQQPNEVAVVGIHVGAGHEDARRFAAEAGITYPLFADPEYRLSTAMGASRVPMIVVLDRGGAIVHRDGEITPAVAAAVAAALLG